MTRALFAFVIVLSACSPEEEKAVRSATQGDLVVFATDEYGGLVDSLAGEFARQYPEVLPSVYPMTTREVIVHLINDSVSTILSDRQLNDEERAAVSEAGMALKETRVAWDALVAIVNRSNRTPALTPDMLAALVGGETPSWKEVAGSGRSDAVEFVTTERNSGLYEIVQSQLKLGAEDLSVFAVGRSQKECVTYVSRSAGAFSLVSLRAARGLPASVRIVPVTTTVDSTSGATQDILPSQVTVYTGDYRLRYELRLITTERRSLTGSGFSTFLLTTLPQKIVQNSGLVPALHPNRVIQLSSE